jgi:CRP-like cAMP-binding protein
LINCLLWLQRAPELRVLGVAVLAALLRDHRPLRYAAGEELFAAGAEASSFLVVVSGTVTCTPSSAQGGFQARPGDVLGRDAALAGLPYQYAAVAETPATAIGIGAPVFWDVAEDPFHVSRAALAMTARRLLSLRDRNVAEGVPAADPTAIVTDGTP